MRLVVVLTGLLASSAASATCVTYDPASSNPRIDFYRCLDDAIVALQDSVANLEAVLGYDPDGDRVNMAPSGGVRIGNAVEGLLEINLPANGESYENDPLHLKTDWVCGVDSGIMYNLEFVGHDFTATSEINIIAVGYMYGAFGHTWDNVRVLSGSSSMDTYCSPIDDRLVFRLYPGDVDFHASGLRVNFMGGGGSYLTNGADTITFVEVDHSAVEI